MCALPSPKVSRSFLSEPFVEDAAGGGKRFFAIALCPFSISAAFETLRTYQSKLEGSTLHFPLLLLTMP